MMRIPVLGVTLLLALLSTQFAAANSVQLTAVYFTYSGVDVVGENATSSGYGYFLFPKGLKTITLSDVKFFDFFQTTVIPSGNFKVSCMFFYSLANLTDFSAVITGIRSTSSLSLDTIAVAGTDPNFYPESFHITSLALGGAYTAAGQTLTVGTATVVPEPTSIILVATGLLGIMGRIRKKTPGPHIDVPHLM